MSDQPETSDGAAPAPIPFLQTRVPTPLPVAIPMESGGRRRDVSKGLEPTRFGDWEKDGRCIDF